MSHKEIAFARPQDVDVAVPASPANIMDIMRNYPLSWERASNGPYFAPGSGLLIGLAAERGAIYTDHGDPQVTGRWPTLYLEPGKASFGVVNYQRTKDALAAMSAGPMLVERGGILDIPSRIREGGFSGFDASTPRPQRAIGITADGQVADGMWESATLYEVAEEMLEAG